ncbi:MAG: TfoX/Sxy family protein [Candidatus Paceibacterota bacterium]
MRKPIEEFHDYITEDVLGHVEDITSKRMFGGFGLYQASRIFAIITSDQEVCFKADETVAKEYAAAGATQFIYTGHKNKQPTAMPYWRVPETVLEDREKIEDWVYKSAALSQPKLNT